MFGGKREDCCPWYCLRGRVGRVALSDPVVFLATILWCPCSVCCLRCAACVREIGHRFYALDRGRVVVNGTTGELTDAVVCRHLSECNRSLL